MPLIVALAILGSVFFGAEVLPNLQNSFKIESPSSSLNLIDDENIEPTFTLTPIPSPTSTLNSQPTNTETNYSQEQSTLPNKNSQQITQLNNNSDPIVTCKSKTGNLQVKLSICKSHTDCPDGSGGYIFETQQTCKDRWQKFGNQLKNITDEYVNALKEQSALNSMKLQQDQQQFNNELNEKLRQQANETDQFVKDLENKSSAEYQKILDQQSEYFKNFIKIPTPTPTPAYAPVPCYGCSYAP